ncbi:MAG: hypothetical protein ABH842_04875 [Candidatus Micrarchaeota archaeon]
MNSRKMVSSEIIGSATVKIRFSKYLLFSTTHQAILFRYSANGYNSTVFAIAKDRKGDRVLGIVKDQNPVAGGTYHLDITLPSKSYLATMLSVFRQLVQDPHSPFRSREPLA